MPAPSPPAEKEKFSSVLESAQRCWLKPMEHLGWSSRGGNGGVGWVGGGEEGGESAESEDGGCVYHCSELLGGKFGCIGITWVTVDARCA